MKKLSEYWWYGGNCKTDDYKDCAFYALDNCPHQEKRCPNERRYLIPAPVAERHDAERAAMLAGIKELRDDCQRWREEGECDMRSVISSLDRILDALPKDGGESE